MLIPTHNQQSSLASRRLRVRRSALASLLHRAEQHGRQHAREEVRILAHGQLKAHVIAMQHCIAAAQAAQGSCERDEWLKRGFAQAQKLLQAVVQLHSDTSNSTVLVDFEQTLRAVAVNLSAAYPACACYVDISGHPSPLRDAVKQAFIIVLYNALHNAYRHAHPSSIAVHLQYAPDATILMVADDGCGLATEEQGSTCGCGLQDMQRVVVAQGGKLAIESAKGKGTRIRATIPHTFQPTELRKRRF